MVATTTTAQQRAQRRAQRQAARDEKEIRLSADLANANHLASAFVKIEYLARTNDLKTLGDSSMLRNYLSLEELLALASYNVLTRRAEIASLENNRADSTAIVPIMPPLSIAA